MWLLKELRNWLKIRVDVSLIAGVDYEENLVPHNAPDAEQDQEQEEENDESENTDNTGLAEKAEQETAE